MSWWFIGAYGVAIVLLFKLFNKPVNVTDRHGEASEDGTRTCIKTRQLRVLVRKIILCIKKVFRRMKQPFALLALLTAAVVAPSLASQGTFAPAQCKLFGRRVCSLAGGKTSGWLYIKSVRNYQIIWVGKSSWGRDYAWNSFEECHKSQLRKRWLVFLDL